MLPAGVTRTLIADQQNRPIGSSRRYGRQCYKVKAAFFRHATGCRAAGLTFLILSKMLKLSVVAALHPSPTYHGGLGMKRATKKSINALDFAGTMVPAGLTA